MTPEEYIRKKKACGLALTSAQADAMSREFREASAWIVGEVSAEVVGAYYSAAADISAGKLTPAEARRKVRALLDMAGYKADPSGGMYRDLRDGTARQKLILDTNIKKAAGYAWYETVKGSLAYPAQRLVRMGSRQQPRDWSGRWKTAYSSLSAEEKAKARPDMWVALTDCGIWARLSRWGDPYPPYDYASGMDVEPVDYDTAKALGLLPDAAAEEEHEADGETPVAGFINAKDLEFRIGAKLSTVPDDIAGGLEDWVRLAVFGV